MTNHRRQLSTDLHSSLAKVAAPYQYRKSSLSYGIWQPALNMIEIVYQHRSAAKRFLTMGVTKNSKLYLQPEEAVFMMQCSMLQVSLAKSNDQRSLPIALDEAYSLWFKQSALSISHLHAYQYLTRIGFILVRHRPERPRLETEQEGSAVKADHLKRKRNEDDDDERKEEPVHGTDSSSVITSAKPWDCLYLSIILFSLADRFTGQSTLLVSRLHTGVGRQQCIDSAPEVPRSIVSRASRLAAH